MQAAKLNLVLPYQGGDGLHSQYQALQEASRSLELSPGRRLYDYSRSHPAGLEGLYRRLVGTEATPVTPSQVIYLASVPMVSDADLCASMRPSLEAFRSAIETISHERVRVWSEAECAGGAHLVAFALSLKSRTEVALDAIAAIPVFSRGLLVPVCANHERSTLSCLIDVQRSVLDKHHLVLGIRKTLPGSASYERGISFQVQLLGSNGRSIRQLDIVSVDCLVRQGALREPATELDWSHDPTVMDKVRAGGALYHFVGPSPDSHFSREVYLWSVSSEKNSR